MNIKYYSNRLRKKCSLFEEMKAQEGTYEEWKKLLAFIIVARVVFMQKISVLKREGRICGVVVSVGVSPLCGGCGSIFVSTRPHFLGLSEDS